MECPFCNRTQTSVVNSRPTKKNTQFWRRRECLLCKKVFTTYEVVSLNHLYVLKRSGDSQRYSRMKLYSGIYGATIGSKTKDREIKVEKLTQLVETKILSLDKKRISSKEIADIVLEVLRNKNTAAFMRFLAYHKNINSENQLKGELNKYLSD